VDSNCWADASRSACRPLVTEIAGQARSQSASPLNGSDCADRRLCGVLNAGAPGHRSSFGLARPAASCCDGRARSWTAGVRWPWASGAANCVSLGSVIMCGFLGKYLRSAAWVCGGRVRAACGRWRGAFPSQGCRALTLLAASEVLLHIALVQLPFERLSQASLPPPHVPAHDRTHPVSEARNRTIYGHTSTKDTLRRKRRPVWDGEHPERLGRRFASGERLATTSAPPASAQSVGPSPRECQSLRPRRSSRQRLIITTRGTVSRRAIPK
jgi:hypothetical protein